MFAIETWPETETDNEPVQHSSRIRLNGMGSSPLHGRVASRIPNRPYREIPGLDFTYYDQPDEGDRWIPSDVSISRPPIVDFHFELAHHASIFKGSFRPATATRTERSILLQPIEPALERLKEISVIEEDWNSYGAKRTTPLAIAESASLLSRSITTAIYDFDVAVDAAPISNGGVILEWATELRRIQVWIHGDGRRSGVQVDISDGVEIDWIDIPDMSDPKTLAALNLLAAELSHA